MQKLFYVSHNSQDLGPFSKEDIELKLKKKELYTHDYVFVEASDDWVLLEDFVKQQKVAPVSVQKVPPSVVHTPLQPQVKAEAPKADVVAKHNPYPEKSPNVTVPTSSAISKEESTVRFSHGEAKVSVRHEKAGTVTVQIVDSKKLGLQVSGSSEIKFVAASASQVAWDGAYDSQVGVPCKFTFRALDKYGNLDTKFDGSVKLESTGKVEGLGPVQFKNGVATKEVKVTKAESVEFRLSPVTHQNLDLKKTNKVNFKPAPASQIVVESPSEVKAGEEAFISVKALDTYGNLDVNFNESITVRLSGALSGDTQVRLTNGTGSVKVNDKNAV